MYQVKFSQNFTAFHDPNERIYDLSKYSTKFDQMRL